MELKNLYKNLIDSILKNDGAFFDIDDEIEWEFCNDDKDEPICYLGEEYKIQIDPHAIKHAMDEGKLDQIEYYLLVAVRQLFQVLEKENLQFGMETITDPSIVKEWDSFDIHDQFKEDFFTSKASLDAFSYAYGVMKYKYENVDCLDLPIMHSKEFLTMVDEWIKKFDEEIIDNG